jgi:hypothetical protein
MSVLGTTRKQPRVFAHDATALSDLCGAVDIIAALAGAVTDGGTNYTAGPTTYATTTTGGGHGATVSVTAIAVGGIVTAFTLVDAGENYTAGDILTLIGGTSNNNCTIAVATITACTTWAWGDPLVPIDSTSNSVPYVFEKTNYYYDDGAGAHAAKDCAALYVGANMDTLVVIQEGKANQGAPTDPPATQTTTYYNVPAGTFLPVSVVTVLASTSTALPGGTTAEDVILALF